HVRVEKGCEQTVPQPENQRDGVAARGRWGDEVDGVIQMPGRHVCQGPGIGLERGTVGQGEETTEVAARSVGDRGSGDEFVHGQRSAIRVRERGLVRGVADLEQLELVEVFRFERLVAYFK